MSQCKSFKVCKHCSRGIVRGGVVVNEKVGFGFSHKDDYYHKYCLRKKLAGYNTNLIGNFFRTLRQYGSMEADLKNKIFSLKI
jgi:hypothetical protein